MQLDAADLRPRSLFDRGTLTPGEIVGGAAAIGLVYGVVPLLVLMVLGALAAAGMMEQTRPEQPPPLENVIQARFLQLGEEIDPRQLPNRRVPILRTDTPEPAPSKQAPMERPERTERQPDAVADALQRLSDDAQIFAEREERRIQEGDPEGIEGGEREASEGDLYAARFSQFLRGSWGTPSTLSCDQVRDMVALASVEIGDDLRVRSFRIVRSSGNPDYDFTVTQQLQRLVESQATIPPPPEDVAHLYIGTSVGGRFAGRNARGC